MPDEKRREYLLNRQAQHEMFWAVENKTSEEDRYTRRARPLERFACVPIERHEQENKR